MTRTIALTGATGFVGAALIDLFLSKNVRLKTLARIRAKLADWDERLEIIEGDLENHKALAQLAAGADAFVHCAGVTHAKRDEDFHTINVEGAANAAKAAISASAKLIHLSSMSAREPSLSPYAASKRASEDAVSAAQGVTLRLPAIYGPRDMVTLPYFKLIKSGFAPEPATTTPARASILHVEDAARAVWATIETPPSPGVYEVGDDSPEGHSWTEIGETLGAVMQKSPKRIRAPRPLLAAYHTAALTSARLLGRTPEVRKGQINEFFHPDWVARDNLFSAAADWAPENSLKEGFAKTVQWYQETGYL